MRISVASSVLSLVLALALAGCGGGVSKVEEGASSAAPVESTESKPKATEAESAKPEVEAAPATESAKPQTEAAPTESTKPQPEAAPAAQSQEQSTAAAPSASQELMDARDEAQKDMLDVISEWDSASIQYAQLGATTDELNYYYSEATDRLFMTCDEWLDAIDAMDDTEEAKAYYRREIQTDRDLYLASMEESYDIALGYVTAA